MNFDQIGEVIIIFVIRGQIILEMVGRGNKIDFLMDFKVLIFLSMFGKIQQEIDINFVCWVYGGDLIFEYLLFVKIVRIFISSMFIGKILLIMFFYMIFILIQ